MQSSPKFYTKKGWLTPYALACGYIEINRGGNIAEARFRLTLELDSGVYHVRMYDHLEHCRIAWDCFEYLNDARRAFSKLAREYSLTRKIVR